MPCADATASDPLPDSSRLPRLRLVFKSCLSEPGGGSTAEHRAWLDYGHLTGIDKTLMNIVRAYHRQAHLPSAQVGSRVGSQTPLVSNSISQENERASSHVA